MAKAETLIEEARGGARDAGAGLYRWVEQSCPVCEDAPARYVGRRGGAAHRTGQGVECKLWRCGSCGLVFPNPMPVPVGGLAQHYSLDADAYFANHDTEGKARTGRLLLRQAEELTGGKGRVLDIGSGRGELLRAAREEGWEAVGIEPSETFARYAEEHTGAEVRRAQIEECGFESESFDAVILSAVLEHLYNPGETIREIARVLRRGGALFVDVPNETGLYFRLGNLYQRLRGRDWSVNLSPTFEPYHLFGFNPRSLRALLAKNGLSVAVWRCYAGHADVPSRGGLVGALEGLAARAVTAASSRGDLGLQIETWALKD